MTHTLTDNQLADALDEINSSHPITPPQCHWLDEAASRLRKSGSPVGGREVEEALAECRERVEDFGTSWANRSALRKAIAILAALTPQADAPQARAVEAFRHFLRNAKPIRSGAHGQQVGQETYRLDYSGNDEGEVMDALAAPASLPVSGPTVGAEAIEWLEWKTRPHEIDPFGHEHARDLLAFVLHALEQQRQPPQGETGAVSQCRAEAIRQLVRDMNYHAEQSETTPELGLKLHHMQRSTLYRFAIHELTSGGSEAEKGDAPSQEARSSPKDGHTAVEGGAGGN